MNRVHEKVAEEAEMMGGAAGLEAEPRSGWRKSRKLKGKEGGFFYPFFNLRYF